LHRRVVVVVHGADDVAIFGIYAYIGCNSPTIAIVASTNILITLIIIIIIITIIIIIVIIIIIIIIIIISIINIIIIIIMIIVIRNHFGSNLYRQQTTGRLPWANGFHLPPLYFLEDGDLARFIVELSTIKYAALHSVLPPCHSPPRYWARRVDPESRAPPNESQLEPLHSCTLVISY
jgi:hypothetical protein